MFNGFPPVSKHMLALLYRQGYRYYVRQRILNPVYLDGKSSFLLSPFTTLEKADYYSKRLNTADDILLYDIAFENEKFSLLQLAEKELCSCLIKIIPKNFILHKNLRNKIAQYIQNEMPGIFEKMSRANFRITIGDNYGKVYYKIRIGEGLEIPINETDLEIFSSKALLS